VTRTSTLNSELGKLTIEDAVRVGLRSRLSRLPGGGEVVSRQMANSNALSSHKLVEGEEDLPKELATVCRPRT
jgi:hypothetical protein